MRIVGTKYCGHDSALCLLDTDKKTVFASPKLSSLEGSFVFGSSILTLKWDII